MKKRDCICAQALVMLVVATLAACGGGSTNTRSDGVGLKVDPRAALVEGRSHPISAILTDLHDEGEWNAVLNFSRLGQAAFRAGDLTLAAGALDQAILRIEAVYANTAAAKRARSMWTSEATKDFKGEPYERAMVYYYRGLVDLALGDFENARASFLSGEFQDTLSEKEEYRSDFAILNWLAGWASHCANQSSLASDYFQYSNAEFRRRDGALWVKKNLAPLEPYLQVPAASNRTLLITESGSGPRKLGKGEHNSVLAFEPGAPSERMLFLRPEEGQIQAADYLALPLHEQVEVSRVEALKSGASWSGEALHYQAMTRGGRPIDGVLAGQAQFKDTAGAVGEAAVSAGTQLATQAMLYGDSELAQLGGALALVGLFASMSSAAAKPAADTRAWRSLPFYVSASSTPHPLDADLVLQMASKDGSYPVDYRPHLDVTAGGCRLVYAVTPDARAAESIKQNLGAMNERERTRLLRRNARRDSGLRSTLLSEFVKPAAVETKLADTSAVEQAAPVGKTPAQPQEPAAVEAVASNRTDPSPTVAPTDASANQPAQPSAMVSNGRGGHGDDASTSTASAATGSASERRIPDSATPPVQGSSLDLDALWSDLDFAVDDTPPGVGETRGDAGRR